MDHDNGERFEQKNYKLIDAVDRTGRLIPFVTIYVPIENKDRQENNNNNYHKLLSRSRFGLQKDSDTKRTVRNKFGCIYFIIPYIYFFH